MLDPNQPCNSNHAKCKKHQDKVIHDYEYTNKKQKKKVKETKKKKKKAPIRQPKQQKDNK